MKKKEDGFNNKLFKEINPAVSGVNFRNDVTDLKEFNYLLFQYMYNGGGVAAGDVNNDGLTDLYFSSNQKSNKLYLNQGEFTFKDITKTAGVADVAGWSTGISFIDINADGLLDIYICKSASINDTEKRKNKLFINQGDNTFVDKASEWGLDDPGYSVQAYFFDYDKDNDLDMYLVNHRTDFSDNMKTEEAIESKLSDFTSDQLYRNDGENFTNITKEAGVYNHAWGLSASIGDFNNDGWEDIYVCNDFIQADFLYINNHDGTFTNEINDRMKHISFYSMGSDFEDLNNDLQPDLIVLDMVSEDHERNIRNMAAMDVDEFRHVIDIGYHRQYMFNMFQLNNGAGTFSEIAQASGIAKSDWSWAPLVADFDNDGYKDIFITNGIKKDVTDIDFKDLVMRRNLQGRAMSYQEVFNQWPATRLTNYAYKNNGVLGFKNVAPNWGLDKSINSNGCTYADLDNDGDLDIVTNNIDEVASIHENKGSANFLYVNLRGPDQNPLGIGARVQLKYNGNLQSRNHYLNRGYLSSVQPGCFFGLGEKEIVNEIKVIWPDGKVCKLTDVKVSTSIELKYSDATDEPNNSVEENYTFSKVDLNIPFRHQQNDFDDFEKEILLPHKQSTFGGRMALGDINGDGLVDLYFGNDKDQAPSILVQTDSGEFVPLHQSFWNSQAKYEDMEAQFFDADQDGDLDLFIVSGGNEFEVVSPWLKDRLYINNGEGVFKLASENLPDYISSGCALSIADFDQDGDQDVFVGGKVVPGKYPVPPSSILLENDQGVFRDITHERASHLIQIGMVTASKFVDIDADNDLDLVLVGEWMPVTILKNENGLFSEKIEIPDSKGWWYSIESADMDADGDIDLVAGNLGKNNKFKASPQKPFHVFANDFDGNGTLDIVLTKQRNGTLLPVRGRECSSEQMPFIKQKFPTFTQFGRATLEEIYGIENLENAIHYETETFATTYFENDGSSFNMKELDIKAQFSPTFTILLDDFNHDGNLDILGAGNLYEAEAETVRYDGGNGYLLQGDGMGNFEFISNSGLKASLDIRDLESINISGERFIVISSINDKPLTFRFN